METNDQIIQWARQSLLSSGYKLKNDQPETVKLTPWSYVARFVTTEGDIYVKHTPRLLALETKIIQRLHKEFNAPVADVIAHNETLNCFLMKDAGTPLREILKKKFDAALLCKAINEFTTLEFAVADHIDIFIDMGVPDWRLEKFPELYQYVLSQKELLIADGVTESEMNELKNLTPMISDLCKKLIAFDIKQTLVQPDFHDNNLLINANKQITLIDLGEIAISHPFFSLLTCLYQVKKHHGLKEEDAAYKQIHAACFEKYKSKKDLSEALKIAQVLWYVYGVLASARLMQACGRDKLIAFQPGKFRASLIDLIIACNDLYMKQPSTENEWQAVRRFRQKYFFDLISIADPFTWTFNHKEHVHFVLYHKGTLVGYAHIQLWPDNRSALRIIVIDEPFRNNGIGGKFLKSCEGWLKQQKRKILHIQSSPEAYEFYCKHNYIRMPFNDPEGHEKHPRDIEIGKII